MPVPGLPKPPGLRLWPGALGGKSLGSSIRPVGSSLRFVFSRHSPLKSTPCGAAATRRSVAQARQQGSQGGNEEYGGFRTVAVGHFGFHIAIDARRRGSNGFDRARAASSRYRQGLVAYPQHQSTGSGAGAHPNTGAARRKADGISVRTNSLLQLRCRPPLGIPS